jgi:hypothetical protein
MDPEERRCEGLDLHSADSRWGPGVGFVFSKNDKCLDQLIHYKFAKAHQAP